MEAQFEDSNLQCMFSKDTWPRCMKRVEIWAPHWETLWALSSKVVSHSLGPSSLFPLFSVVLPMDLDSSENVFHHHFFVLSSPLTNLNLCTLRKKRKEGRNVWKDKRNTTLTKSDGKSQSFIYGEIRLSSGEHPLFIFWKVLFDRPFAVDVTLTKHAVTGLFEYGDRLIITLKSLDNTAEGKWTGLPISCWKDCGWNRVFLFQEQWYKLTALILFIRAVHTVVKGCTRFLLSTLVSEGLSAGRKKKKSSCLKFGGGRGLFLWHFIMSMCVFVSFANSLSNCQNQVWQGGKQNSHHLTVTRWSLLEGDGQAQSLL